MRYTRQGAKAPIKTKEQNRVTRKKKERRKINTMENTLKGYDYSTGLFKSRYYAKKYAKGDEVAVKVEGGYTIMTADYYYRIWKKQK